MDLESPHHENEIAQSRAAKSDRFATTWMHNGFVSIDNEKRSKSLGNFFAARDRGDDTEAAMLSSKLRAVVSVVGILQVDRQAWFRSGSALSLSDNEIDSQLAWRRVAQKAKSWADRPQPQ